MIEAVSLGRFWNSIICVVIFGQKRLLNSMACTLYDILMPWLVSQFESSCNGSE